ncbi:MAG TPA: archease [Terriglobales bacterium]|jgi:SHS2 domain-containing protein|nr:archease [Terriglobales bacterium]
MADFEEIEHTADWAFRARGQDLAQLLENAAQAMSAFGRAKARAEPSVAREVEVRGIDRETLLVNWLNEILYLEQTRDEIYDRFQVSEASDSHLRAKLYGRPSAGTGSHIKAATFHNLQVRQTPEGFEATVVLDV